MIQNNTEKQLNSLIDRGNQFTFRQAVTTRDYREQTIFEYGEHYQNWIDEARQCIKSNFSDNNDLLIRLDNMDDIHYSQEEFLYKFNTVKTGILEILEEALEQITDIEEPPQPSSDSEVEIPPEEQVISHNQLLLVYDEKSDALLTMLTEMFVLLKLESTLISTAELDNRKERTTKIQGYTGVILCIQKSVQEQKKLEQIINSIYDMYLDKTLILYNIELALEELGEIIDEEGDKEHYALFNATEGYISFDNNLKLMKMLKTFSSAL